MNSHMITNFVNFNEFLQEFENGYDGPSTMEDLGEMYDRESEIAEKHCVTPEYLYFVEHDSMIEQFESMDKLVVAFKKFDDSCEFMLDALIWNKEVNITNLDDVFSLLKANYATLKNVIEN